MVYVADICFKVWDPDLTKLRWKVLFEILHYDTWKVSRNTFFMWLSFSHHRVWAFNFWAISLQLNIILVVIKFQNVSFVVAFNIVWINLIAFLDPMQRLNLCVKLFVCLYWSRNYTGILNKGCYTTKRPLTWH